MDRSEFQIIDCHRHFMFGKADVAVLLQQMQQDGVDKTVLFGYHGINLLDAPHEQDQKILKFAKKHPSRLLPFFCDLDFYAPDAEEYVSRCAQEHHFLGMGEILFGHTPIRREAFAGRSMADPECIKIFQLMGQYGLPVLFHADPQFTSEVEQVLRLCPNTHFIWAHVAYDFCGEYGGCSRKTEEIKFLLLSYANLYFDISLWKISPIYLCEHVWIRLLERFCDRFLLGFDMSENYLLESAWIHSYYHILDLLSDESRRKIAGENLMGLLPVVAADRAPVPCD